MKILAHALAQITRFADVNHSAEPVLHQINARFVRQLAQLAANLFSDWHGRNFTQRRERAKEFLNTDGKTQRCGISRCEKSVARLTRLLPHPVLRKPS